MRAACHALSACSTILAVHPSSPPHPPSHCPQCGNTNVNLAKSFFWDQASATWPCHLPTTHLSRTPTTQRPHAHFPLTSLPPLCFPVISAADATCATRGTSPRPTPASRPTPPPDTRAAFTARAGARAATPHTVPAASTTLRAPLSARSPQRTSPLTARALRTLSCACRRCNEHTTASPMCEGCVSTRRALEEKKEKVKPTLLHAPSS